MNVIDLQGRHAVIPGGAQGIGLAVAARLLASGASVTLWDRDPAAIESALKNLNTPLSISTEIVDVADMESVAAAAESTATRHGRIDILVAAQALRVRIIHCGNIQWRHGLR